MKKKRLRKKDRKQAKIQAEIKKKVYVCDTCNHNKGDYCYRYPDSNLARKECDCYSVDKTKCLGYN